MNAWDKEVFARTLWMECRGEPDDGRRAVCHVILNRFERAGGKLTIAGVCMKDQAFSCWNAARDDSNREQMNALSMEDSLLQEFRDMVDAEYHAADPVGGASLYYATSMIQPPPWVQEGKTTFVKQVGKHRFYRE